MANKGVFRKMATEFGADAAKAYLYGDSMSDDAQTVRNGIIGEAGDNKKLNDAEKDALFEYTTSKYQDINGGLRNPPPKKEVQDTIKKMDSAMEKSRISEAELWRGASIPEVNAAIKAGKGAGFTFTDKGFTSTSTDRSAANNFNREGGRMYRIVGAKKGVNVSSNSNFGKENEIILPRGATYRIKSIDSVTRPYQYRTPAGKLKTGKKKFEEVTLEVI